MGKEVSLSVSSHAWRFSLGARPNEIYHVAVMPCYDKKLEASRQDFFDEEYSTRDVDCVITTGEMNLVMQDKGWDLSASVEGEEDGIFPELVQHPGSSSGSYLQTILDHKARTWPVPVEHSAKTIRNSDYEEHTLTEVEGGRVVFKGARTYGFKNLQNVVRKVGKAKGLRVGSGAAGRLAGARREGDRGYDYVEVMACPGGCVNGGGQLRPATATDSGSDMRWGNRQWSATVEAAYWRDPEQRAAGGGADQLAMAVMGSGLALRTEYRAVESSEIGLAVQW